VADAIAHLVETGTDAECNRVNVLELAASRGLAVDPVVDGFVHASKLGLFDMSWNILCPGCGGVLDAFTAARGIKERYACTLCANAYEPSLDEMIEVSFTVNPAVRKIRAHDPDTLDPAEYYRQMYFGQGLKLPQDEAWRVFLDEVMLDAEAVAPNEKVVLTLQLPAGFVIVFDPVTHATTFFDVKGEPVRERRDVAASFRPDTTDTETIVVAPGPVRLSLHNMTGRRIVPGVFVASDRFHDIFHQRRAFFTAKHLFSNQTFRDVYRTDTLSIDQRLRISSLTFLFTDLKSSTELYERVGDLSAYDLVQKHFLVLSAVVRAAGGAVVKTIGDAIMATFPSPDRGLRAALGMRDAMLQFNRETPGDELPIKIGLHAGPCLAVMLNERLDYFGTTVNTAARVQGLAAAHSILTTDSVLDYAPVRAMIEAQKLEVVPQRAQLRGIKNEITVYDVRSPE
jgi:class 3 adenylate cyclase